MVIDGQGGGIGKSVIEKLNTVRNAEIVALGTNPHAARQMEKAGFCKSYCGEASIIENIKKADIIIGAIGIIAPGAMMGEITPGIALAVAGSSAKKVLIPVNKCNLIIAGAERNHLTEYIQNAVDVAKSLCAPKS